MRGKVQALDHLNGLLPASLAGAAGEQTIVFHTYGRHHKFVPFGFSRKQTGATKANGSRDKLPTYRFFR